MGFENTRRWPAFILLSVCLLLTVSLFNSWTNEAQLRTKLEELGMQTQECAKKQSNCMQESLSLMEEKERLHQYLNEEKGKVIQKETQQNHTKVDLDICQTELQSLKSLQISKTATLDTLRLEKETLTGELAERKIKIEELESEIARLKIEAAKQNKAPPNKATPVPPKPALPKVIDSPINEIAENNAQEVIEEPMNDNNPIPLDE